LATALPNLKCFLKKNNKKKKSFFKKFFLDWQDLRKAVAIDPKTHYHAIKSWWLFLTGTTQQGLRHLKL
jgi:hypothetical protein